MSSLLTAKRKLEAKVGPVNFERSGRDADFSSYYGYRSGVIVLDCEQEWLGEGETLSDAIVDAHETLRVRDVIDAAYCRGDYEYDLRKDGEL